MEQSVIDVSATILQYNKSNGQWIELGSESGVCTLSILKSVSNEYRFVAWKDSNQEVVLNTFLFPKMHYNESTPSFHQWFDETQSLFGLNFSDQLDAKRFSSVVTASLNALNSPIPAWSLTVPVAKVNDNSLEKKKSIQKKSKETVPVSSKSSNTSQTSSTFHLQEIQIPTVKQIGVSNHTISNPVASRKQSSTSSKSEVSSTNGPPPPGPPPPGPPPPGPPPPNSAPQVSGCGSSNKLPSNDFVSQLQNASQNMKKTNQDTESKASSESVAVSMSPKSNTLQASGPTDFLSELKMKSKNRTSETSIKVKRHESSPVVSPLSNGLNKNTTSSMNKVAPPSSESATTYITSADLERLKKDLMKNIISNMERIKIEIISDITSKLS